MQHYCRVSLHYRDLCQIDALIRARLQILCSFVFRLQQKEKKDPFHSSSFTPSTELRPSRKCHKSEYSPIPKETQTADNNTLKEDGGGTRNIRHGRSPPFDLFHFSKAYPKSGVLTKCSKDKEFCGREREAWGQ